MSPDGYPRVHLERPIERLGFDVRIELGSAEDGGTLYLARADDGSTFTANVRPGEVIPLYLHVEDRIATALGEALSPRPEATERHLDDAIATRDRLLALVEGFAFPPRLVGPA